MKRPILYFISLPLLLTTVSFGQSIDVETERCPGTKKLVVKSYNGCCAKKGYKAVYLFDSIGRAIKSYNYFKKQLLASYEYHYNEKGLLAEKIRDYDINNKSRKDTTNFIYTFDQKDRVITKTIYLGNWSFIKTYSDFDALNNPTTVRHISNKNTSVEKREYNSLGQQILNYRIREDTIIFTEENKYNEYGDMVYSNIPSLLDKETGKMVMLIGGSRHSVVERYDYTYDKLNRWTKKYVLFDNRKVKLEKRIYR